MSDHHPPNWEYDGQGWPNRHSSRFLSAGGLRWHVQQMGSGPIVLLLHGTGAATHSWRDLAPLLAQHFTVIAPDLPGHGFTSALAYHQMSLPNMANAIAALLATLGVTPALVLGHSAGAAILIRLAVDGAIAPHGIISINGALLPWRGLPAHLFSPAAKLLAGNDVMAQFMAWRARDRRTVEKLIANTGSTLTPAGVALYQQLVRQPSHVRAALAMMANWNLDLIEQALPQLDRPLCLMVGAGDLTVSPREAERVRVLAPHAEQITLPALGHLAHEEQPALVAALVGEVATRWHVLDSE
ncbi:alpha/beta hydrolase [Chromatium okenii]|uniref:alpha/beta fold hydrolase BchO n=1 Tax=Chromatium okenii TaxID=61644 RepID=UPI001902D5D5|nr:alpha/beta fold hydrolase BchO [Chromatium okenii]MBK1641250.1 alpha/beta hydrolase [Chromatium okenii]